MLSDDGVVGEEATVSDIHAACVPYKFGVADEIDDKVLISHFDCVLIGLTFILFVFCFSTLQR